LSIPPPATRSTSYFDFDPELACMMAAGFEPFTAVPLTRSTEAGGG
jgi:hypothetical protein